MTSSSSANSEARPLDTLNAMLLRELRSAPALSDKVSPMPSVWPSLRPTLPLPTTNLTTRSLTTTHGSSVATAASRKVLLPRRALSPVTLGSASSSCCTMTTTSLLTERPTFPSPKTSASDSMLTAGRFWKSRTETTMAKLSALPLPSPSRKPTSLLSSRSRPSLVSDLPRRELTACTVRHWEPTTLSSSRTSSGSIPSRALSFLRMCSRTTALRWMPERSVSPTSTPSLQPTRPSILKRPPRSSAGSLESCLRAGRSASQPMKQDRRPLPPDLSLVRC
mmetsp:Transcript_7273/g.13591  ORF Transcript_7273/g.13591 Transcript_7273/m.13591 type:complete len:279 (-) Transcript_7273:1332-2168(-)